MRYRYCRQKDGERNKFWPDILLDASEQPYFSLALRGSGQYPVLTNVLAA